MHKFLALVLASTLAYALGDSARPYLPSSLGLIFMLLLALAIYKITVRYLDTLRD